VRARYAVPQRDGADASDPEERMTRTHFLGRTSAGFQSAGSLWEFAKGPSLFGLAGRREHKKAASRRRAVISPLDHGMAGESRVHLRRDAPAKGYGGSIRCEEYHCSFGRTAVSGRWIRRQGLCVTAFERHCTKCRA